MNTSQTSLESVAETGDSHLPVFRPRTNVVAGQESAVIQMELPGARIDDLEVDLDEGLLTVRGKRSSTAPEGFEQGHTEFAFGNYQRSFRIGPDFDSDNIEARFENGLLSLTVPRRPRDQRRIQVQG